VTCLYDPQGDSPDAEECHQCAQALGRWQPKPDPPPAESALAEGECPHFVIHGNSPRCSLATYDECGSISVCSYNRSDRSWCGIRALAAQAEEAEDVASELREDLKLTQEMNDAAGSITENLRRQVDAEHKRAERAFAKLAALSDKTGDNWNTWKCQRCDGLGIVDPEKTDALDKQTAQTVKWEKAYRGEHETTHEWMDSARKNEAWLLDERQRHRKTHERAEAAEKATGLLAVAEALRKAEQIRAEAAEARVAVLEEWVKPLVKHIGGKTP
jgi:hypothetical protein